MQLIHRVSCAAVSDCFFCFVQISEVLSAPFGPSNFVFFPAFDKPHPVCPSGKAILCARLEPSPRRVCFARRGMYGEHGAREKISSFVRTNMAGVVVQPWKNTKHRRMPQRHALVPRDLYNRRKAIETAAHEKRWMPLLNCGR